VGGYLQVPKGKSLVSLRRSGSPPYHKEPEGSRNMKKIQLKESPGMEGKALTLYLFPSEELHGSDRLKN